MRGLSFRHVSATVASKNYCTTTGWCNAHLPRGKRRDEVLTLIRLGAKFKSQQCGKRPGVLARLVLDCARRAGPPYSFAQLLDELEREAARRELHGERASPIEKVDRIWQLVTIHVKQRRVQKPFKTFQNKLTVARKIIITEQIPDTPKQGITFDTLTPSLNFRA